MNVVKIAWRSIQHRGLGSLLTIVSMALGVMLVVAVLSIHGVVSQSFKSNNSFGYNVIVGARGGGLQLTMNTVYYLSQPVENIPYEYYLAFEDQETRARELENSIAHIAYQQEQLGLRLAGGAGGISPAGWITDQIAAQTFVAQREAAMELPEDGLFRRYVDCAVPLCLGDSYVDPETLLAFRCVGTKPNFFTDLVLDIDTEEKFQFAEGRCFVENSPQHGFFECVIGAAVARRTSLKIGDTIQATHGDPDSSSAHIHEQNYTIVGILDSTGTPNDRVVFLNMEGFYLMEDHAKPVENDSILKTRNDRETSDTNGQTEANTEPSDPTEIADPFAEDETFEDVMRESPEFGPLDDQSEPDDNGGKPVNAEAIVDNYNPDLNRSPLPIEQREVTAVLVRTSSRDPAGVLATLLPSVINEGQLETTLGWSAYRPEQSQKAAQAVNPVDQVSRLFTFFVDPIRWILLALTSMICIVSALSIVVGIYNSMNQRQHEIAVMRALGANRSKVMLIMLSESILLAVAGGLLGWFGGHALNAALGPIVEDRTGVNLNFFSFAPPTELAFFPGAWMLPDFMKQWSVSPELLLIPALILLAVLVGLYPAISAYKTDVSRSLGK
jgi:putative ABC transport system permease protein